MLPGAGVVAERVAHHGARRPQCRVHLGRCVGAAAGAAQIGEDDRGGGRLVDEVPAGELALGANASIPNKGNSTYLTFVTPR